MHRIDFPPFTDWRTAASYPIIVPPAPIDAATLPTNAPVLISPDGRCVIELP